MSIYVGHKDVNLQGKEDVFELKFGFVPSEVLIGFDKFKFSYGDKTDHHVKELGLSIASNLDGELLKCTVKGVLSDGSKHKMETGNVRVSIVAYADESTEDAVPVSALQSFNLKFSGDDHHIGRYAVSKNGSFMEDGSGHQADCSYSMSSVTLIPHAAIEKMKSENVHFISRFGMGMYNGDHHISHTGIEINRNGDKITYDMSDKQGNHAECNFCKFDVADNGEDTFFDKILKLDIKGKEKTIAGNADVPNIVESHIQGVVKYENYYIMSHNNKGYSKGVFVVSDGDKKYEQFDSYDEHYNHPGGMQRYESYMLVGVEDSSHKKSYIRLYNLSCMSLDKLPRMEESFAIERSSTGTCALGICKLKDQYIIAAYAPHGNTASIDFYTASADKELPQATFTQLCSIKTEHASYQNIALYAEQDGTIYLVGFRSDGGTSEIDYIDLFEAEMKSNAVELQAIYTRHLYTEQGSTLGTDGVHFRWGAGLEMDGNGNIMLLATQRNFVGRKTAINEFREA